MYFIWEPDSKYECRVANKREKREWLFWKKILIFWEPGNGSECRVNAIWYNRYWCRGLTW